MSTEMSEAVVEPIAVIGMSCRFPGARTPDEYWRMLLQGEESIRFHTREQLADSGIDESVLNHPDFVSAHGAIDDVDMFDAKLFEFSAREAEATDPQHRVFLECAWEALETAGYDPAQCMGAIGMFAGSGSSDYLIKNILASRSVRESLSGFEIFIGNDKDFLPTRTSYKLNLTGPSMAINTACSSSLVSAHTACQALQNYDCDIALAGSVKLHLPMTPAYIYQEGMILSQDGHCRPFDADADGTVSGSGVGLVVLKRLEDALEDGDNIYAVIRGGAVNNDGRNKVGFTAPSVDGQARVLTEAYQLAGVDPATVGYVEGHGTGTRFGDPVEVSALTRVYSSYTDARQYCALGSVKANIGHLDTAAGIAGLIKTILVLRNRVIPPSINWSRPNPELNLEQSPFFVATEAMPWQRDSDAPPRRAAVSSFGIGGTNAHLVLEEAPQAPPSRVGRGAELLVWSGMDEGVCEDMMSRCSTHLGAQPETSLVDMAYTLAVGRKALPNRSALVCGDVNDAVEKLSSVQDVHIERGVADRQRTIVFMFPGQGAETLGMGASLYSRDPVFAGYLDQCLDLLGNRHSLDIRRFVFADAADASAADTIHDTRYAQPALFCIEYALAQTLQYYGVVPAAVVGHSLGEYVAACVAGVMTLEAAMQLVVKRGALMAGLPQGEMVAIPVSEDEVRASLPAGISIAAVNSLGNTVVSGPAEAMELFKAEIQGRGIACKVVNASYGFHSAMVDTLLRDFETVVAGLGLRPPKLPMVSNLTGGWANADCARPEYWSSHMRGTVRFQDCIDTLRDDPDYLYVEVGPGQVLTTLACQCGVDAQALVTLLPRQSEQDEKSALLKALGQLWVKGVELDWDRLYSSKERHRIALPTYPFQRERYWIEPDTDPAQGTVSDTVDMVARRPVENWFYQRHWKRCTGGTPTTAQKQKFLVLSEDSDLHDVVAEALKPHVESVRCFAIDGADPAQGDITGIGSDIDWNCSKAFDQLLETLESESWQADAIVYCWPIAGGRNEVAESSLIRLVHLAQSIAKGATDQSLSLNVIACNAFHVLDGDVTMAESALPMGVVNVLPMEVPSVSCRFIDLDRSEIQGPNRRYIAESIGRELIGPSSENLVALRGIDRWVSDFEPMELSGLPSGLGQRLFEDKTVVITGGFGGIGRTLASALASAHGVRLALIGRRRLPAREQWNQWIATHHQDDRISILIRTLMDIEAQGAELLLVDADVAEPAQMRDARQRIEERFGCIDVLMHAAGVPAGGLINLKQAQEVTRVLRPKVAGTSVLAEVFGDAPIDTVVLFSSVTSLSGWLGQVDYTAANAYLDSAAYAGMFAGARRTIAVNWDAWAEVGMAVNGLKSDRASVATGMDSRLDHPLFESRREQSPDRAQFSVNMSPSIHWVLGEHRIVGIPTVPGTFHIEVVRAAFALENGVPGVHIDEITFNQPMMVADRQTTRLEVDMATTAKGTDFVVRSEAGESEAGEVLWKIHAVGKLSTIEPGTRRVLVIDDILARCREELRQPVTASDQGNAELVQVGERWNSIASIRIGEGEALARLSLPQQFHSDFDGMNVHPAMLDIATGFAGSINKGKYLPLAYKNVCIHSGMQPQGWCYVRRKSISDETNVFEICITDDDGVVLIDIGEFVMKRVAEQAEQQLRGGVSGISAQGQDETGIAITPAEGVDVMQRLLAREVPNQVAVSVVDLNLRIQEAATISADSPHADAAASSASKRRVRNQDKPLLAPATDEEETLLEIWKDFFRLDEISVDDNFFDLGGDSLLATQLFSRIQERLDVGLSLSEIFEKPTIRELGSVMEVLMWEQFNTGAEAVAEESEREVCEI